MKKKTKILIVRSSYNDTSKLFESASNRLLEYKNVTFLTYKDIDVWK